MRALAMAVGACWFLACAPAAPAPAPPAITTAASGAAGDASSTGTFVTGANPAPSESARTDADAGPPTGGVDAGVIARIFDRVGDLMAQRIRQAASAKYASRQEALETLDKLLSEWTHLSGMSDILADFGVKADDVEAYVNSHPKVLERQGERIAGRMEAPMQDFKDAVDRQFPRPKGK